MGVDFPDIGYVVNWGQARTLLDQHQQDVLEEMGSSHMLLPYIMDSNLLIAMMMLMQEIFNDIPNLDAVFYCC